MNHAFRSTWGALLWKEWRQQRLPFLVLGGLCLAAYFWYGRVSGGKPDARGAFVLLVLAATCLGANAFAAEQDDRTDGFLTGLPLPRWRRMAAKYVVVGPLALLCLALPLAIMPSAAERFWSLHSQWGTGVIRLVEGQMQERPASLVLWALLLVTASVSLTCALAGRGFGGLATLLLALVPWAIHGFFLARSRLHLYYELYLYGVSWATCFRGAIWFTWAVIQLAAVRVWFRRGGEPVRRWWRLGLWSVAVLSAPVLAFAGVVAHHLLFAGPVDHAGWLRGRIHATPGPSGSTILLSANPAPSNPDAMILGWSMNADTGSLHRLGSSGGRSAHLQWLRRLCIGDEEMPPEPGPGNPDPPRRPTGEWQPPPNGAVNGRFTDGTRAYRTEDGWQFQDLAAGTSRLCRHPAAESPGSPTLRSERTFWLDRAIATVRSRKQRDGALVCTSWRYAADQDHATRVDIALGSGVSVAPRAEDVSRDGKWLLLKAPGGSGWPYLLASLVDGTTRRLPTPLVYGTGEGVFFTPDTQYLLFLGSTCLRIWNLSDGAWEEDIRVPGGHGGRSYFGHSGRPSAAYAVSPGPPWRVVIRGVGERSQAYVLHTERQEAVALPLPKEDWEEPRGLSGVPGLDVPAGSAAVPPTVDHVAWLGNGRVLMESLRPYRLWVIDDDGSNCRRLLP